DLVGRTRQIHVRRGGNGKHPAHVLVARRGRRSIGSAARDTFEQDRRRVLVPKLVERVHSRGSTGSLSSARIPNTHSCTRRKGWPLTKRVSASTPKQNSRRARLRLRDRPRWRSRARFCGRSYSGP